MRFINKIYNTFTSILLFEKCITIFRSKKIRILKNKPHIS